MSVAACDKNNNSNPPPPNNNVYPDNVSDEGGRILHCHARDRRGRDYSYDVTGDPNNAQTTSGPRGSQVTRYSDAQLTIMQEAPASEMKSRAQKQTLATIPVNVEVTQDPRGQ